jgi:ketosteroid isomerase-like protein
MKTVRAEQFAALMQRLAEAWSDQNAAAALACFTPDAIYMEPPDIQLYQGHAQLQPYFGALTPDAIYMEPPDIQLYQGHAQLQPYFGALKPGTFMVWHHLAFDPATQVGLGEFSFGMTGRPTATHGVAVVDMRDGRIAFWREYHRRGPAAFDTFLACNGKSWQWHIDNYP